MSGITFHWIADWKLSSKTAFSVCIMPISSTVSLNGFLHASYFCRTLGGPWIGRDCIITRTPAW